MALSPIAHRGNTPLVRLLVDYRAPINARNEIGETALHFSANRGYSETIALLLEKGANISVVDDKGRTPFHCVVMSGYRCELVVQTLLCSGADITTRDYEGRTILHCAVGDRYGREDVIKLLLEKGADITSRYIKLPQPVKGPWLGYLYSLVLISLHLTTRRGLLSTPWPIPVIVRPCGNVAGWVESHHQNPLGGRGGYVC